jgi:hypothetical protein
MPGKHAEASSMANPFRRDYLLVSSVPPLLIFICVPLNGITMMVSATTSIDEVCAPIVAMRSKAEKIAEPCHAYAAHQSVAFSLIAAVSPRSHTPSNSSRRRSSRSWGAI